MFLLKEVEELHNKFADKAYKPNALDGKTKELIALACSVMVDCVPCINYHYKKAVGYVATGDETSEALAITMSASAGRKKAKYSGVISELERG